MLWACLIYFATTYFILRGMMSPVLSELQRIVSFSWAPGPCLIHTEMVKGSFRLVLTMPSGTLIAWVPLNSKTWSLSCPLSVGSPTVQLAELLGAGRSSTVPELAPSLKVDKAENYGMDGNNKYYDYHLQLSASIPQSVCRDFSEYVSRSQPFPI